MTEKEAREQATADCSEGDSQSAMPRGHVDADLRGAFKAVGSTLETKEIVGAIHLQLELRKNYQYPDVAMDNKIPYTYLSKQIHPLQRWLKTSMIYLLSNLSP